GPRFAAVPPERLTDIVRNLLTQRLKKLSSRNGQETPAARDKLETLWNAELAAAALLDEIAREHGDTRFAGGPLFLRSIDRLDQFRAWLRGIPAGSRRDELARRFSSNARVA